MCVDGKFVAFELKHGNNTATRLQVHTLNSISVAGGYAAICKSLEDVKKTIKEAKA
jgi:hypothetical protein